MDYDAHTTTLATRQDWWNERKCRKERQSPSFFFPAQESDQPARAQYCKDCPVRLQCLELALWTHEHLGVWGGATERERRALWRVIRLRLGVLGPEVGQRITRSVCQEFFATNRTPARQSA